MAETVWNITRDAGEPPSGVLLDTVTEGGIQQTLVYENGLWWFPDKSMYVYFVPQFWRSIPGEK